MTGFSRGQQKLVHDEVEIIYPLQTLFHEWILRASTEINSGGSKEGPIRMALGIGPTGGAESEYS